MLYPRSMSRPGSRGPLRGTTGLIHFTLKRADRLEARRTIAVAYHRPRNLSFIVPQARDDGGSEARSTRICYLLFAIREALLRSGRREVKIDLPCGFEEILFTVGRHFTRNLARFRFIIR